MKRFAPGAALATGFLSGVLSGLLGIGGGILMILGLVGLLKTSQHEAHATSLAAAVPVAGVAASMFASRGLIDWATASSVAAGGLVGALIGARLMASVNQKSLRTIFALFLAIVGIRMILMPG